MFLIRRAKTEDIPTLLKLAKMVHFINLPADKDIITDKVMRSRESFQLAAAHAQGLADDPADHHDANASRDSADASGIAAVTNRSNLFMFVMEDTDSAGVLGTSQIISRMGGPGHPNLSFQLTRKDLFSTSLQQGHTHVVAKLVLDESSPTEIGGLILQPSYRGHKLRLGRFLSLVRFHFVGLYRPLFADRVLAEMMAPITADGRNPFWEYFGRRFINLTYTEADRFCQYSKEFMTSLLPREEIYLTLLPPEARTVVGQVGPETVPARRMLEKLGFRYRDRIDPFDGGPNLDAPTDQISIVAATTRAHLADPAPAADLAAPAAQTGFVSVLDPDGEFRALETAFLRDRAGNVRLPKAALKALEVEPGAEVGLTPMGAPATKASKRRRAAGARA